MNYSFGANRRIVLNYNLWYKAFAEIIQTFAIDLVDLSK
jgi:hypothetical protein